MANCIFMAEFIFKTCCQDCCLLIVIVMKPCTFSNMEGRIRDMSHYIVTYMKWQQTSVVRRSMDWMSISRENQVPLICVLILIFVSLNEKQKLFSPPRPSHTPNIYYTNIFVIHLSENCFSLLTQTQQTGCHYDAPFLKLNFLFNLLCLAK